MENASKRSFLRFFNWRFFAIWRSLRQLITRFHQQNPIGNHREDAKGLGVGSRGNTGKLARFKERKFSSSHFLLPLMPRGDPKFPSFSETLKPLRSLPSLPDLLIGKEDTQTAQRFPAPGWQEIFPNTLNPISKTQRI